LSQARAFARTLEANQLLALCALLLGCGLASRDGGLTSAGDGGGVAQGTTTGANGGTTSGGVTSGGNGGRETQNAGVGNSAPVAIDASDCASRPLSDCQGVTTRYESNIGFDDTPAFAHCGEFNSFDHCGALLFGFDAEGCAVWVSPGGNAWARVQHLSSLQTCLTEALGSARYPCLASGQLYYAESCFVR
jgi:hypothetical protein